VVPRPIGANPPLSEIRPGKVTMSVRLKTFSDIGDFRVILFGHIFVEFTELIHDSRVTTPVEGSSNQKSNAQEHTDRASNHSKAIFGGQSIDLLVAAVSFVSPACLSATDSFF
jgi:hypothetical protein